MTLNEIKTAISQGETVCWGNEGYEVEVWPQGLFITCLHNNSSIGLTHRDGVTVNGKPEEFFIKKEGIFQ